MTKQEGMTTTLVQGDRRFGVPHGGVHLVHERREVGLAGRLRVGERVGPGGLVLGHVGLAGLGERGELAALGLDQGDQTLVGERGQRRAAEFREAGRVDQVDVHVAGVFVDRVVEVGV